MSKSKTPPVAIVTGSSRGIGRATAIALAGTGTHVIVNHSASSEAAEETAQACRATGGSATVIRADITDPDSVAAFWTAFDADHDRLDVMVNNVGKAVFKPFHALTPEEVAQMVAANLTGPILMAREGLRRMAAGGRLINTSSIAAHVPGRAPHSAAAVYGGVKAGFDAIMKDLIFDAGRRGITVNSVLPGLTRTAMAAASNDAETEAQMVGMTPLGRAGQPEDIADVMAFLASDRARWVTGQSILVSGGLGA
ncbi:MAG: SDR family oxidoreductase [Pseudomonadota bacterium]